MPEAARVSCAGCFMNGERIISAAIFVPGSNNALLKQHPALPRRYHLVTVTFALPACAYYPRLRSLVLFARPTYTRLIIGYDTAGNLLEIAYNIIDDDTVFVFHAMPCRKKFIKELDL